ncbi:MAG TPA: hypothetical protein VHB50_23310, partial [Bryobacteraceae bacterium]|nr:hypothetical protein [Bryobacteraceae bacterium]
MRRRFWLLTVFAAIAAAATNGGGSFDPERYLDHIKFLASPEMRGRASGSPELEKAAQYIAGQFHSDGLQSPPGARNYLQPF